MNPSPKAPFPLGKGAFLYIPFTARKGVALYGSRATMVQDFWEKRTEGADQGELLLLLHAQDHVNHAEVSGQGQGRSLILNDRRRAHAIF
jgi:hypothetical protein